MKRITGGINKALKVIGIIAAIGGAAYLIYSLVVFKRYRDWLDKK